MIIMPKNLRELLILKRVPNKIIGINEWYETPFLKFKLIKNNQPLEIDLQNIVINLRTIDQTVK